MPDQPTGANRRPRAKQRPKVGTDAVDQQLSDLVGHEPLLALNLTELAKRIGMDRNAVSQRVNREAWKKLHAERYPPNTKVLASYRDHAARVYVDMLAEAEPNATREKIARILSGAEQPTKIQLQGSVNLGLAESDRENIRRLFGITGKGGAPEGRRGARQRV